MIYSRCSRNSDYYRTKTKIPELQAQNLGQGSCLPPQVTAHLFLSELVREQPYAFPLGVWGVHTVGF